MSNYNIMAKKKYLEYLKKLALESETRQKTKENNNVVKKVRR